MTRLSNRQLHFQFLFYSHPPRKAKKKCYPCGPWVAQTRTGGLPAQVSNTQSNDMPKQYSLQHIPMLHIQTGMIK